VTALFMRNIRLQGIMVGSRAMFARMNAAIESSSLQPVIDRVFPFEHAPDAFQHLASQSHIGKVVIRIP
jgi:NADPH:quinone reductase-like Zn-dependent oxidoreductase